MADKIFRTSRISAEGSKFFPTEICFGDTGVTISRYSILRKNSTFLPYRGVCRVLVNTPMIGFSSITFITPECKIEVHGFYKKVVLEMKRSFEMISNMGRHTPFVDVGNSDDNLK